MKDTEIIRAASMSEAITTLASLYPTLTDYTLISRRNDRGQFSKTGHNFTFEIEYEVPDEPAPDDLGEEEY